MYILIARLDLDPFSVVKVGHLVVSACPALVDEISSTGTILFSRMPSRIQHEGRRSTTCPSHGFDMMQRVNSKKGHISIIGINDHRQASRPVSTKSELLRHLRGFCVRLSINYCSHLKNSRKSPSTVTCLN